MYEYQKHKPKQLLENKLIAQLQLLGYQHASIAYERDLVVKLSSGAKKELIAFNQKAQFQPPASFFF